jgi:hypothetical protein
MEEQNMLTLSTRNQIVIGLILALLMTVTRSHHFATLAHLPGASWAVFFLAGVYLRPVWVLPGLLALAWLLDLAAYTWGGTGGFCLTPAYVFLLPAYGALWFGGRWYANRYRFEWHTLMPLSIGVLVAAAVCELFSSGGFYFLSGRFAEPTFAEFGARLLKYFPPYLQALTFYVGIAVVVHTVFALARGASSRRNATAG